MSLPDTCYLNDSQACVTSELSGTELLRIFICLACWRLLLCVHILTCSQRFKRIPLPTSFIVLCLAWPAGSGFPNSNFCSLHPRQHCSPWVSPPSAMVQKVLLDSKGGNHGFNLFVYLPWVSYSCVVFSSFWKQLFSLCHLVFNRRKGYLILVIPTWSGFELVNLLNRILFSDFCLYNTMYEYWFVWWHCKIFICGTLFCFVFLFLFSFTFFPQKQKFYLIIFFMLLHHHHSC